MGINVKKIIIVLLAYLRMHKIKTKGALTFFPSLMSTIVCDEVAFGWDHFLGYAMLAFGVFFYEACEMEEVRLCGGRWWENQRMGDRVGIGHTACRVGASVGAESVCTCLHLWLRRAAVRIISVLLLFPGTSGRKPMGGVGSTGICPPTFRQTSCLLIG